MDFEKAQGSGDQLVEMGLAENLSIKQHQS